MKIRWILNLYWMVVLFISLTQAEEIKKNSQKKETGQKNALLLNEKRVFSPFIPQTKYNEPWDLIELIPVVRDINRMIPRRFSLVHHEFQLAPNQLVIQNSLFEPKIKSRPKNSIIALHYSGGFSSGFGTQLEVPLFYSSVIGVSEWSRYPVGSYKMIIQQSDFSISETLFIRAQTKF
ncbi:MAG: hypothetical protein A3I11_05350 [Elusimicrobia bacterium RIFCSPLOWO2_02_FULL_39_32]|nr:MAG: hypothetical protein A2034_02450 [Elusimicrobia bacterium GWA2_38_7]OGR80031.1 MAG: hypothetical protein A3B80_00255 [Elusimicrobia bacterium RIFCSPHIGHO2_02_FULL_39_36]OGR91174.1 MAG: hypothetical protein A3I11_05350 [Elusimicrobia bacterium RIFCSPLOWO2_02_FULL_39_32]OGS00142.1 MAG: hypothetical protein A3G85_08315 [Elusimicrobia bacterium RIFCSPLOWO2_12_FULL_39_28]